jgi:MEMO1 family protein
MALAHTVGNAAPALRALPGHRGHGSIVLREGATVKGGAAAAPRYTGVMGALPPLRRTLDIMPSPDADHPGLLIRDPLGYSEGMLVCPPPLVPFLRFFDGAHEATDLESALRREGAGEEAASLAGHLRDSLARALFLDDEDFLRRRDSKHAAFARAPHREPAHAGSAYPEDVAELRSLLAERMGGPAREEEDVGLVGIAAPHASPEGAWESYRRAYGRLAKGLRDRTFIVLGTSHYGRPDRFGLTTKAYETPLGRTSVDEAFVGELLETAGPAVTAEDYCHAVEHSIEFQVLFLQHALGSDVRVVPVLCGPFTAGDEGRPEDDPGVSRFLEALRALCARQRDRLFFVLGVDLAHVGRRYGDRLSARAGEGALREVEHGDRARLLALAQGDAGPFWSRAAFRGDALNWCGTAPLYTFLRVAPRVRGEVLHYEQWQIDSDSVVSCASLAFREAPLREGE